MEILTEGEKWLFDHGFEKYADGVYKKDLKRENVNLIDNTRVTEQTATVYVRHGDLPNGDSGWQCRVEMRRYAGANIGAADTTWDTGKAYLTPLQAIHEGTRACMHEALEMAKQLGNICNVKITTSIKES